MAELVNRQTTEKSTKHEDMLAEAIKRTKDELYRVAPVIAILDGVETLSEERENEVIEAMVKQNYHAIKKARTNTKWNRDFEV